MALFQDRYEFLANSQKGDWCFIENDTVIYIRYGDEWHEFVDLPINQADTSKRPSWNWDGNRESPTLSPSIRIFGGDGKPDVWHGYLRAGKLENA